MTKAEAALKKIWAIVADAQARGARLSQTERINIMQWCAFGLGANAIEPEKEK